MDPAHKDILTPDDSVAPRDQVKADLQLRKMQNPKDSFKTTWRDNKSRWTLQHYILDFFYPAHDGVPPVFKKTDPLPVLTGWVTDVWVVAFASWPLAVQWVYTWSTGNGLPPVAAFFLYWGAFLSNAAHAISMFERLGHRYGYLDGEAHRRDDVPDVGVAKAVVSLLLTTFVRPLFTIMLTYDRQATPLPSIWLPAELLLYSIVLDFFFYAYHRSCHEVDWLWRYHRTHHLTKHPNSFLSSYADHEQELLEIALIPIATWATLRLVGLPMTFHDWWFCHQFIVFAELIGHSGLRLQVGIPGLSKHVLYPFGAELIGEDHDLHHRKGYRKSNNYGKQTRLWDVVFGTCGPRFETAADNIDHSKQVSMPFF